MSEEVISSSLKLWVPGNPAPFATRGEQPWREALVSNLPQCPEGLHARGLVIDFYLADLAPLGHPLDVDNLCEPVFSILINRKGWFSGRRPNLTWWRASKCQSSSTGCQIEVSSNDAASIGMPHGVKMFDAHYSGPLPVSARDPCMSKQIRDKVGKQKTHSEGRYFIFLRFDNTKLNIGDIATGKVKTTIDSLYPVIGGVRGQPEDWRVNILQVEKRSVGSSSAGVHISIWKLD
ncbi:hypothetical protein ES703_15318 [subsurface metagenome]